jgi:hypothetical protein
MRSPEVERRDVMNALLLALLLSGPPKSPANPNPEPTWESFAPCGQNEVYHAIYYYQSPGGAECGLTYQYCYVSSPPRYHEGCTTAYHDDWYAQCYCP